MKIAKRVILGVLGFVLGIIGTGLTFKSFMSEFLSENYFCAGLNMFYMVLIIFFTILFFTILVINHSMEMK